MNCRFLVPVLLTVAVLATGCGRVRRMCARRRPELLAPRAVVPGPYAEPSSESASFGGAAPAGVGFVDEGLGEPPPIEDFAPPSTGDFAPPVGLVPDDAPSPPEPEPDLGDDGSPPDAETSPAGVILPPDAESDVLTYTVQEGDSLWKIGRMYGVTFQELAAFNNLDPDAVLSVGKVLRIPPGGRLVPASERRSPQPAVRDARPQRDSSGSSSRGTAREPIPANGKYTVRAGDSLWAIARRYGLSSEDLMEWNDLDSDLLQIGQVLLLRTPGAAAPRETPRSTPRRSEQPRPDPTPDPAEQPAGRDEEDGGAAEVGAAGEADAAQQNEEDVPAGPLAFPKTLDHTVAEGETLRVIAEMYGTTVEAILRANPTVRSDADLTENMRILVPYR